jgi:ATP-dependent helicase HepA
MDATKWTCGQRWVSDSEPELGLGLIREVGDGRVDIEFPAAGEKRCYAMDTAPLRRVSFSAGDRIRTQDGTESMVISRRDDAGLWIYETDNGDLAEGALCHSISFSKPEDRLFGGKLDSPRDFDLRGEALQRRAEMRRSPVRGLAGARMDLIPHQLFIADEVARRPRPRVLLADEVGLGKTIEACLILHRLLLTGVASRVLILVPEPLVHQWFVELLRRFQLSFSLFDEERCEAIEQGDPEANPFLDSQWVLAPITLLSEDEHRAAQAGEAGWDLLIVDEAHHLEWSPDAPGPAYQVVSDLAKITEGLLLLTATPQQLGPEGHFARLRLLDPDRYSDLAAHAKETNYYETVAQAVEAIDAGSALPEDIQPMIARRPRLVRAAAAISAGDESGRKDLIHGLLDSFGVGRVMFRNTRSKLGGFPKRQPQLVAVDPGDDARVAWLIYLLDQLAEEKVLVITHSRDRAEELVEALRVASGVTTALFHEDLSLLQRDRNAAYFAEADGARVLVCSEIGSEGRNFQFARHLVLMDLPEDVDLLEQRIGRLDRIGQKGTIMIHVPYVPGTGEDVRVRWLDEGLNAFRTTPPGASEIQRETADALEHAMENPDAIDGLLEKTQSARQRIANRLAKGQDRLLERTSHHRERSAWLANQIRAWDQDQGFEDFVLRLFEYSGLHIEDLGDRRYFLLPGHLKSDAFPALPPEGLTVTLDRTRALEREQEAFLTWDHPMIRGALDWMLTSESGNACFAVWEEGQAKQILLEAWLVLECVAPPELHLDRFLPQTPLRVMVDHTGQMIAEPPPPHRLRQENPGGLMKNPKVRLKLLPEMLDHIRRVGEDRKQPMISTALAEMQERMETEIVRLRDLAEVNDHVRQDEIELLETRKESMSHAIKNARLRVDAVRLIWKAPK